MAARSRSRMTMLAGWLFADLFLVLLIAGLAALPAAPAATPGSPHPPSASASPRTTPATPAAPKPGLDPHQLHFTIPLTPGDFRAGAASTLLDEVNAELGQLDPSHRLVGFALVYATDDLYDVNRAVMTATSALRLLRQKSPFFTVAQGLGYWSGGPGSDFEFRIFLLNS